MEWAMLVHTLRPHSIRHLATYELTFLRFFISRYSSSKLAPTMVMGSDSTTKPQNMTSMAVSCPMK
eukprot:scaffold68794_cov21-Phaeocystis_antarctica.AAC.1